ncbi:GNAT family N-acetyltransferase [Paenibacillus arenilitoris]|uniref:GNAT family N-acetyltransferase n=1 Tax=Paenibacillus arenilitoris TaxID=2772299 RepID=A0A927H6G8_9BACL|nr:GNAT family N-acetyltransferase [Paenibacillus arenilitoris]MBD2870541.1 GNAT family N-acetyltransferase [Paenibacillus arenilitoris]
MRIRHAASGDYYEISPLLDRWWGGRPISGLLPKLFFDHFNDTSFVAEEDGVTVGFLIGFLSQSSRDEAYIHFVGVHPDYRKRRIGRTLYERFFDEMKRHGRTIVRCITSPVNRTSIAYHTAMGFQIVRGDGIADGVSVHSNYDGPGQDRVLFAKRI